MSLRARLADAAGQVGARKEGGLRDAAALDEQVDAAAEVAQQKPRHCKRGTTGKNIAHLGDSKCDTAGNLRGRPAKIVLPHENRATAGAGSCHNRTMFSCTLGWGYR